MDCQYANNCVPPAPPPPGHFLPFTGSEIIPYLIVGLIIICAGMYIRWHSSKA